MKSKVLSHWHSDDYYSQAALGSVSLHPGMDILKELAKGASSVLDLGCGEGTRLHKLVSGSKVEKAVGVDISAEAIKNAKRKYRDIHFLEADLEDLPVKSNSADLVYSAFVLEHTDKPEKVLKEAIRVTKKGGNMVFIAPNFGAPNRSSPPYSGSRIKKLIEGFLSDLVSANGKVLKWGKVRPIMEKYESDFDTTVEPYLRTLIKYLNFSGTRVKFWSACWPEERQNAKLHQKIFRFLGESGIYPFRYWGPHILIHAVKL